MVGAERIAKMKSSNLYLTVLVIQLVVATTLALENGLSRTPPMGWLSWERFRCNTDCVNDPDNCIGEKLYTSIADKMVNDGYLAAGYQYVNVDDCWPAESRGPDGKLVPEPTRFPNGMKYLADYMHERGLKFGIYEDYGNYTCAGYPGSLQFLELDANTFAEWEVDYVKLDGCYSEPIDMDKGYPEMGRYLNATGRPMVYSCSWPAYQVFTNMMPNYTAIAETCNLWRNYNDIQDSWESVLGIVDYYGDTQDVLIPHAGPGHWNDPDMLIVGDYGLSYDQSKAQMAIWAILAAPLIMSNDLRTIKSDFRDILLNRGIIAVNQDPLGIQGRRIYKADGIEIWARPITPVAGDFYSYSIAFLNRRTDGTPSQVKVRILELGLSNPGGYDVTDLYSGESYGVLSPAHSLSVQVNPTGIVILRANAIPQRFTDVNHLPYFPTDGQGHRRPFSTARGAANDVFFPGQHRV